MGNDLELALVDPELAPAAREVLQFFRWEHLPPHLARTSRAFCTLAVYCVRALPECTEMIVGLRKLLEAKDAAVRATATRDLRPGTTTTPAEA